MNIFNWLFLNLVLSSPSFLRFLQKRGKFPLLISLLLAASGCSVNRRGYSVTSEKEHCHMPPALNTEQSATVNGDSSDSGNLSLSCSVSSVKIEELEILEVESCLESYLR